MYSCQPNQFLQLINISITRRKCIPLSCILFSEDRKMWLPQQLQTEAVSVMTQYQYNGKHLPGNHELAQVLERRI